MENDACLRRLETCAGAGRTQVALSALDTGRGWACVLVGGESPHVGGVVLAVPRPSLRGRGQRSCDVYSTPVSGHLDNEAGIPVAKALCIATGTPVSLSSGIHIDDAAPDELRAIERNCREAADTLLAQMSERL